MFLGNVPHHATEDELKVMFGRFGTVVDLRIHSKPGPKMPGLRAPQNYGFITYDDPESVQNCLANTVCTINHQNIESLFIFFLLLICYYCFSFFFVLQPLYYPENSPDGQKLNVEEKKARMRNENMNNTDRSDRDRGVNRTIPGAQRNSGGPNRNPNTRPQGRPFNRNDRQQQGGGPRGNNNSNASTGNGSGSYGRR